MELVVIMISPSPIAIFTDGCAKKSLTPTLNTAGIHSVSP